jgi:ferredoxin-nitrite reductase
VLAGELTAAEIVLNGLDWYARHGITLHLGKRAERVDRVRRVVLADDGTGAPYDRLLIATGSTPVVLPVPGNALPGVLTYRDLADAGAMISAAARFRRAVVIGGGLLGLEAANGLRARGMDVAVVHLMPWLMERQLDEAAAGMLRAALEARGIAVRLGAETEAILPGADGRVGAVRLKGGAELAAELVVMAVGIRPNVELARTAGLYCGRGIVVNDTMQTYDPRIYAVGECVAHRGVAYGLVAPLYEMARVCATHLAGFGIGRYQGSIPSTRLKVTGIDVFSAGEFMEQGAAEPVVLHDADAGRYRKVVLKDSRVVGAVLYGDTEGSAWLLELMAARRDVAAIRDALLFGPDVAAMLAPPAEAPATARAALKVASSMSAPDDFTDEQKRYLEGFASGQAAARAAKGLASLFPSASAAGEPAGPEAIHVRAQNRFLAEGKKLVPEEEAKRKKNPLDMWDELRANARERRFPKGTDVFLYKFHGLFYVAPAQDAFMCRLRIPNGILDAHQLRAVAELAESYGGGYAHVTTRANLQIREIRPENAVNVVTGLVGAGLTSRGAGADNIRNITGNPTAGIDPQELYDTRPLGLELHHYILNHRELYGLPRKFNVAFDGGGRVASLEDTNDIGFGAVRVATGRAVAAGVYFRVAVGGVTGHLDFARDLGVLIEPQDCVPVAAALVRVFIEHGDRTDRKRARMKYVLDRLGLDRYLEEAETHLGCKLVRLPLADCAPRPGVGRLAHVGFHPQKQAGKVYAGVVLPVGKLTVAQMRGLAGIAERYGSGTIRLTVWQNLLVSDIDESSAGAVAAEIEALGLGWRASSIRAGLVACTGNTGCKFSAADTKRHALAIADHCDVRLALDVPVNVHLTGCHHSCAQHYIGDVGLLATKVSRGEDAEVEGYHLYVGGGCGADRALAREVLRDVPAERAPGLIERLLAAYLEHRSGPDEPFHAFAQRHPVETLRAWCDAEREAAAA